MPEIRLLASIATYLLVAGLYGHIGLRLFSRPSHGNAMRACRCFGLFWFGLGTHSALAATLTIAELVGDASAELTAAAAYAASFAIAIMCGGLMAYLLYVFTGRRAVFRWVGVAYAIQLVPLVGVVWFLQPTGVTMEGWIPIIDYARAEGSALDPIVTLVFVLPPLIAAGSYVALFTRLKDPASRWRLGLVGGAITLWLASAVLATAIQTGNPDVGAIIGRSIAIAAALTVLAAYEPPAWAQRRFGAVRLGHEVVAPSADPALVARKREALAARARELV